jgi:glycerol-3-phosphate dehydrogenase (NAD(P)+)
MSFASGKAHRVLIDMKARKKRPQPSVHNGERIEGLIPVEREMRIAVVGAGSWGTTLANLLAGKGHEVSLWVREEELLQDMLQKKVNTWFLPEFALHPSLVVDRDLESVLSDAQAVVMVVPCQFLRAVLRQGRSGFQPGQPVICASKGVEIEHLKTMSEVVEDELGDLHVRYCVLSGPSFAREVSEGLPTAVTLASGDRALSQELQKVLSTSSFRVYSSTDTRGVELGGAVKNVMALAAGISDGLEFGHDARAALITRGLAEMARLGAAMGARERTFMGLSGLGDLVLTCTGDLSRNRQVGKQLGQGKSLRQIETDMRMVAEGVKTTMAVHRIGSRLGVDLPITGQVYRVLYEHKDPRTAVQQLMERELKGE